jgi:hypothetical protein
MAAGRPERQTWAETAALVDDAGIGAAVCRLPHCDLLADPVAPYCRVHAVRWHQDGCPADADFEAAVLNYGDPRWDFRRLPPQLKLELQYGLQRSHELGYGKSAHSVGYLTRMLLRIETTTLLERTRAEWTALFRQRPQGRRNRPGVPRLRCRAALGPARRGRLGQRVPARSVAAAPPRLRRGRLSPAAQLHRRRSALAPDGQWWPRHLKPPTCVMVGCSTSAGAENPRN